MIRLLHRSQRICRRGQQESGPPRTRRHRVIAAFPGDRGGDGQAADPLFGRGQNRFDYRQSVARLVLRGVKAQANGQNCRRESCACKWIFEDSDVGGYRLLLMQFDLALDLPWREDTIASPQIPVLFANPRFG
jgi:hypothetical protein